MPSNIQPKLFSFDQSFFGRIQCWVKLEQALISCKSVHPSCFLSFSLWEFSHPQFTASWIHVNSYSTIQGKLLREDKQRSIESILHFDNMDRQITFVGKSLFFSLGTNVIQKRLCFLILYSMAFQTQILYDQNRFSLCRLYLTILVFFCSQNLCSLVLKKEKSNTTWIPDDIINGIVYIIHSQSCPLLSASIYFLNILFMCFKFL